MALILTLPRIDVRARGWYTRAPVIGPRWDSISVMIELCIRVQLGVHMSAWSGRRRPHERAHVGSRRTLGQLQLLKVLRVGANPLGQNPNGLQRGRCVPLLVEALNPHRLLCLDSSSCGRCVAAASLSCDCGRCVGISCWITVTGIIWKRMTF